MAAVAEKVADGNILRLIEKFLRSGVMENGVFKPTTVGNIRRHDAFSGDEKVTL